MTDTIGYGILNTERFILLKEAGGKSVWNNAETAETVKDTEFGGATHLKVVQITEVQ